MLFLTLNSSLRSTTCVLDALFRKDDGKIVNPTIVFTQAGPWQKSLKESGIKTFVRPLHITELSTPYRSLKEVYFWYRLIKTYKIHIIHVNEHELYPTVRIAAKLTRTPSVVFARFVVPEGFGQWAFSERFRPNKILFTSSDQITRSKPALPTYLDEKDLILIGNGRDFDHFTSAVSDRYHTRKQWGIRENHTVLGSASTIRPRKRLEDFILLIDALKKEGIPVQGVLAGGGTFGDPEYYQKLADLIVEKGLTQDVFMLGNLDSMTEFYQAIDAFISTSELETFGLSVCEAMSFSIPVVAYEGGSVQEVLFDKRGIVPNCDQAALFEKTKAIICDKTIATDMGEKSKKRVFENFNAPILANKLISVYKDVLNSEKA